MSEAVNITNFKDLLSTIDNLDEKKQKLWIEIYQNAVIDRQLAFDSYTTLKTIAENKSSEYAIHGRNMSSFLERMNKANEQIVRLATMIEAAQPRGKTSDDLTEDEIFEKINKKNK